jgi:hypothetical protein
VHNIVNDMSGGQKVLFIHCKSRDDDLGMHNLVVGGKFSLSFRPNFWGTTLYWCYMRADNNMFMQHSTCFGMITMAGFQLDVTGAIAFGSQNMSEFTCKTSQKTIIIRLSLFTNGNKDTKC